MGLIRSIEPGSARFSVPESGIRILAAWATHRGPASRQAGASIEPRRHRAPAASSIEHRASSIEPRQRFANRGPCTMGQPIRFTPHEAGGLGPDSLFKTESPGDNGTKEKARAMAGLLREYASLIRRRVCPDCPPTESSRRQRGPWRRRRK